MSCFLTYSFSLSFILFHPNVKGVFNGDPHPGNILVLDDGRLGLIDYGQCKRLTPDAQTKLARLVCCVADYDNSSACASVSDANVSVRDQQLADAFRALGLETANDSTAFISSFARLALGQLKSEHMDHGWHMRLHKLDRITTFPPDMMIFLRTAMLLRGLGLVLKQNLSVAEQWKYYAERHLRAIEA